MSMPGKVVTFRVKRVPKTTPNADGEWVRLEVDEQEWSKHRHGQDRYRWLDTVVDQAFFVVAVEQ